MLLDCKRKFDGEDLQGAWNKRLRLDVEGNNSSLNPVPEKMQFNLQDLHLDCLDVISRHLDIQDIILLSGVCKPINVATRKFQLWANISDRISLPCDSGRDVYQITVNGIQKIRDMYNFTINKNTLSTVVDLMRAEDVNAIIDRMLIPHSMEGWIFACMITGETESIIKTAAVGLYWLKYTSPHLAIKKLMLTNLSLMHIPVELFQNDFSYLAIKGNDPVKTGKPGFYIPKEICSMTNLKSLNLSGNGLKSIDFSIGNLTNLEKLILDDNQLSSLPAEISKLSKLRSLSLARNNFKGLPYKLTELESLKKLYFDKKSLIVFDNAIVSDLNKRNCDISMI